MSREQRKELIEEIKERIKKITAKPIDELISHKDWGKINFDEGREDLESIFDLCSQLLSLALSNASASNLSATRKASNSLFSTDNNGSGVIERLLVFDIEDGNYPQQRSTIINDLINCEAALFQATHTFIPYLAFKSEDYSARVKNLVKAENEVREIAATAQEVVTPGQKEVNEILQATREAAGEAGVAEFTKDFTTQATDDGKAAHKWLIFTVVLAVVTTVAMVVSLGFAYTSPPAFESISVLVGKFVLFGFLIAATGWCGGKYNALKHQQAISKFKANSLQTFRAFVSAAEDKAIKDAVLMETTKAIFEGYNPGYIKETGKSESIRPRDVILAGRLAQ